jgi:tight adherence protein B
LFCPPLVITRRRLRRVQLIEEQVEPWLTVLANALHANPSLGEAIASTASLLREPIASELELIVKEHQLGSSLERALTQAAQRIGGNTFKAAVTILKTARRTGGNLPETLSTVVANLREMARLEGVVRTKTAEGKTQAFIISVVPLPLYLGIRLLSPQFFTPLETTFIGHLIFGVAALLWLSAFMLARRFVAVDV